MLKSAALHTIERMSALIMALVTLVLSAFMAFAQPISLQQSEPESASSVLKKQQAKLDTTKPTGVRLAAQIEELRNLDFSTPQTDWNKAYSIGRQAYIDSDFSRACSAFQLALSLTRVLPASDARVIMTRRAADQVKDRAESLPARAGYKPTNDQKSYPQIVERVFPGSLAWLSGVKKGDHILSGQLSGQYITLNLERDRKAYSVQLKDLSGQYDPLSNNQTPKLHGQITDLQLLARNEGLLANHDVIILVDKSRSMSARNCPGNLSVWDWCRLNTVGLLQTTQPYFAVMPL